ncbi:MAG: hypothetical protein JO291_15395, partial [Acidimicrobiia bacterium]|nr:hypothetical protein [Acidimicrobiia bacterium]
SDVADAVGYVPTALTAVPVLHRDRVLGVLSLLDATTVDMGLVSGIASLAVPYLARSAAAASFGRTIARAMAAATDDTDLADALREAAEDSDGPSQALAELAAVYAELGRLGDADRAAATRIVAQFTAHVAGSRPVPVRRVRR